MKKDVIITVFACSAQAPCQTWAKQYFDNEPLILNVPGGGGPEFRAKAIKWGKTGDLFAAAVKELAPQYGDIEIGNRGLVTFSVGWSFADELFKFPNEIEKLDSYLLLDGCHTDILDFWVKFAARAANMDAFMVMAHTEIKPPFISTTTTNTRIFERACKANGDDPDRPTVSSIPPEYIVKRQLDKPVTVSLAKAGTLPAIKKSWDKDPLVSFKNRGALTVLAYSGNDRPDHVYVSWYVSEVLWRWLGETWNMPGLLPISGEYEI